MNEALEALADATLLGLAVPDLALAVAAALATYLAMRLVLRYMIGRMRGIAQHTSNRVDDTVVEVLAGTNRAFLVLAALLVGVGMLDLPERWNQRVGQLWFIALALQAGLWFTRAIGFGLRRYEQRHSSASMTQVSASATLMSWSLRTVLWAVILLAVLSNLGVNITAFVASLGVGGIAIALAMQNILGDLFASLSIAVDKPFEVGDFIVVNTIPGTVELVGLKTTRIRALSGEQVVMSNTELLKNTINNYKRLVERRIVFKFGITYGATPEQAGEVPKIVRRVVEASDKVRFDRAHFQGFGESSLDYEVVYIVLSPDYNLYMDIQQSINLGLMRELARLGVEFAHPTRTVIVDHGAGQRAPDAGAGAGPRLI